MKPSLGRIVLYRSPAAQGSRVSPAIVTDVNTESVNLTVFSAFDCPTLRAFVPEGRPEGQGECWYWPPREAPESESAA